MTLLDRLAALNLASIYGVVTPSYRPATIETFAKTATRQNSTITTGSVRTLTGSIRIA
ncbi:hypothetical protein NB037_01850 [Rathayibacter sp. ZW T2_19]|uniref:Uncharacterized protein n=1 Tax=Rathayibacter rubneri TaxID=2950106 RepID=A0A9X2DVV5_9MICO|nr:hypothetical protein [Rathayibacter rubneri]MCM6761151.1 hypothetical protein [Rathayibacter rubneri]